MFKRIISSLVGIPLVAIILIFGNKYIVDVVVSIIAIMALYEYYNCFKEEKNNGILRVIGYVVATLIAFIHVFPKEYLLNIFVAVIPGTVLILFLHIIFSNMKYNIKDISITLFGICYIVFFIAFLAVIREMANGKILIWFVFASAWGTDIFAYFVGRKFGKHKFSKISPNKSIEGCVAGVIGSIVCMTIYTIICNNFFNMSFSYGYVVLIAVLLSVVGQIGDLAASSIKRYTNVKDFSNLIPGHGGMLDRVDSVIFIAPFAYFLLMLI